MKCILCYVAGTGYVVISNIIGPNLSLMYYMKHLQIRHIKHLNRCSKENKQNCSKQVL